jgi:hypothetical protein
MSARFPQRIEILETHPGGGTYDCLTLVLAPATERCERIDLNRNGSAHVWNAGDTASVSDRHPCLRRERTDFARRAPALSKSIGQPVEHRRQVATRTNRAAAARRPSTGRPGGPPTPGRRRGPARPERPATPRHSPPAKVVIPGMDPPSDPPSVDPGNRWVGGDVPSTQTGPPEDGLQSCCGGTWRNVAAWTGPAPRSDDPRDPPHGASRR